MNKPQLYKTLQGIGLSEVEAKVYTSALVMGGSSIIALAKHSQTKRTTVYSVVQSLVAQGVMRIEFNGLKKLYAAQPPEDLYSSIHQKVDLFSSLLPKMQELYDASGTTGNTIRYYESSTAIEKLYMETIAELKPHDSYRVISDLTRWSEINKSFAEKYLKKRAGMLPNARFLVVRNNRGVFYANTKKQFLQDVKFLPSNVVIKTNVIMTPNRMLLHKLTEPTMAILVMNRDIMEVQQQVFDLLWNYLPE